MRDCNSQLFLDTGVKGPKVIGNDGRDCDKIMSVGNPTGTKWHFTPKNVKVFIPMCEHSFWIKIRG